jgi:hypothetical protein
MTAVEKLELSLLGLISFDSEELRKKYKKSIEKAKENEKQQTIEAHNDGYLAESWNSDSEQYYKEKFNK